MQTNGFAFGYSDLAVLDRAFPNLSYYVFIPASAASGHIVYLNTANQAQWIKDAIPGFLYPIGARMILSSGTVNGVTRSTTATELMYCCGGTP